MPQNFTFSIRNIVAGLGLFSVLIALGLAGFGVFAIQIQATGLDKVILLQTTLRNHQIAKTAADDLRIDVLRAAGQAAGWNREGTAAIGADVWSDVAAIEDAIQENLALPLQPRLHIRYVPIATLATQFSSAALDAIRQASSDTAANRRLFERTQQAFAPLEVAMTEARDVLEFRLMQAEYDGAAVGTSSHLVIGGSVMVSVLVIGLMTWVAVRIVRRILLDLSTSRAEAHHLSLHDVLTGLPNRAMFDDRLEQALTHMRRSDCSVAMLCIDLDRFKQVNDTYGHATGDLLLQAVAERLRATIRDGDTVARLGGDEFVVVQMPIDSPAEAGVLAAHLIDAVSRPYELAGHQVTIGASIGIALAPHDAMIAADLRKMADLALYRAKSNGRGVACFFEAGMAARVRERQRLEADLRASLEARHFEVHYQPFVDLASDGVVGFEALVRWRHPERGLVPPGEFIPIAEETGLIGPLGLWVLQQACADAATWPRHVSVAVNVSAVQFRDEALAIAVFDVLEASGLEASRLELEITETALLTNTASTLTMLRRLQAFGVRIAMDDFGTGYSSLSYLRSFPFDKIKIDQSFVRDIETNGDCKSIVRAITGLGLSLGISIIAEGAETAAQIEHLRAEGCNLVQGYYFSRPVPVFEVADLLRKYPGRERCSVEAAVGGMRREHALL